MKVDRDLTGFSYGISASHALLSEAIQIEAESFAAASQELAEKGMPWTILLEARTVTLAILLASYLEALINVYLSLKTTAEKFSLIEGRSPVDKWTIAPALFAPEYQLDKADPLYSDLESLFLRRNQIMHMKPELTIGDKKLHKGNSFILSPKNQEDVIRWLGLPRRLVDHLGKYDKSHEYKHFQLLSWTGKLSDDWERRLTMRLSRRQLRGKA